MRSSFRVKPALTPEAVLLAYCNGYFPMADSKHGTVSWYTADPRAIIPLEKFKISRSLAQVVRRDMFTESVDAAFEEVIRSCAERADTWISAEIIDVYIELHRRGFAHSVECWKSGKLAGGLYGVALGRAFFGESMFSREPNASKVALVHLVRRLQERGYRLLDSQFMNEHIRQFGAVEIPARRYFRKLADALGEIPLHVRSLKGGPL